MGASNVSAVYTHWGHLKDRSFRLLTYMALVSYDEPKNGKPARLYYGEREALAAALGRKEIDARSAQKRHAALESVRAPLADLVRLGAVTRVEVGGKGKRANYRLNLNAGDSCVTQPVGTGVVSDHNAGDSCAATQEIPAQPTGERRQILPLSQGIPAPKEQQEQLKMRNIPKEDHSPTNATTDRARETPGQGWMTAAEWRDGTDLPASAQQRPNWQHDDVPGIGTSRHQPAAGPGGGEISATLAQLCDRDPERYAKVEAEVEDDLGWIFYNDHPPHQIRARDHEIHRRLTQTTGGTP